jgi:hypothetical protein
MGCGTTRGRASRPSYRAFRGRFFIMSRGEARRRCSSPPRPAVRRARVRGRSGRVAMAGRRARPSGYAAAHAESNGAGARVADGVHAAARCGWGGRPRNCWGAAPHPDDPPRRERERQPQPRHPLGVGHARARPLPAPRLPSLTPCSIHLRRPDQAASAPSAARSVSITHGAV